MSKETLGVGVIGCGNISITYFTNLSQHYKNIELVACADMFPEKAQEAKEKYGIRKALSVDELLADPEVELVINLTIPGAHFEINKKALDAGKHVYCEKPLALSLEDANTLVDLAKSKGLYVASAPDTYLGAGIQTCRKLIDEGAIGTPTGFTANMVCPGHELWHPAAAFHYKKGGGPMLDMGPYYVAALVSLFGPIKQLSCFCKTPRKERMVQGQMMPVESITSYAGIMEFENGAIGNINMSFDVWSSKLPCLEVYGTTGAMYVPDPNMFKGPVMVYRSEPILEHLQTCETFIDKLMALHGPKNAACLTEEPLAYPTDMAERANMRGLGVSEMASSILKGRAPRLEADFARHVVEALTGFAISAEKGEIYKMTTTCERPRPMAQGLPLWQVD